MAKTTFTAEYSGGTRNDYDEYLNYTTAHDDEESKVVEPTSLYTGQQKTSGDYFVIYRGFIFFDTSTLLDDCLIKSATLKLVVSVDNADIDFNIIIRKGDGVAPHNPLQASDFYYTQYSGNGGSVNTSISKEIINLNNTGLSWISKTNWTILALISERDINYLQPEGEERISWYEYSAYEAKRPKLEVEWYAVTGIPVLEDVTLSNTKDTHTTASVEVNDTGGGYTERGFEYGLSENADWVVRQTGVFTDSSFSLPITNLKPSTTYYVRAFITNKFGTAYSQNWTEFTTSASPSYGIYKESNTATICFYVRRAGGKWSIKHGPYTTDQADIEIGKILTEGKGKYQIKFTSDVLTGLSVNIMTKLDIRARG